MAWPGVSAAPLVEADALVPPGARAVILAPHPDDEILMAGGLLQQLYQLDRPALVIAVTDGEGSHPSSLQWPPSRLQAARPLESQQALSALHAGVFEVVRLHLPDARVGAHSATLHQALATLLHADDVLFSTWSGDGHPDHDACGAVAARAAAAIGARHVEVPVWTWHWSTPDDARVPWHRLRRLPLTSQECARKQQAATAFVSQLGADPSTGRDAVLPASARLRLARDHEFFFV
jgi:LmbE family N-acetylglucosaminyl deacetylase